MKPTAPFQQRSSTPALSGFKKLARIVSALALVSAAPAMASTITFEAQALDFHFGGDQLLEAGYTMTVLDSPAAPGANISAIVVDGADPTSCGNSLCPGGNSSVYYLGLNDGGFKLERSDQQAFVLHGLDYAFFAPLASVPDGLYGQLSVTGQLVGGGNVHQSFDFAGLGGGSQGGFAFSAAALSAAFNHLSLTSLSVSACKFDGAGGCFNMDDNQSQFAIDNINVSAVPEPDTYALMLAGLAGMGLVARRRAKHAPSSNA